MKKSIILYIHELTYTGSPFSTLRLGKALIELGCDVAVWSYRDGSFRKEFEKAGICIEIVEKAQLRCKEVLERIRKYDLMIANTILTREAVEAARTVIPTVWYIREAENIPEFFGRDYKRGHLLKKADNIWAVSEYAESYIRQFFNENVTVLHNCVDDEFSEKKQEEADWGKQDTIKVMISGTIEPRKGFDVLVAAFHLLPPDYKKRCELHIVGRKIPSAQRYYDGIMKEVAASAHVIYHGEIDDREEMLELYRAADVVAVVSRDESCSLVALEAAMMQKPLIISKNVGARYLVGRENGWIVETDSPKALCEAIKQCIDRRELLADMGRRSREKYLETSTFEIYKENLSKAIEACFVSSQKAYASAHWLDKKVWQADDLERVSYPDWGYQDEGHHLYSFDVFDTLMTRQTASPKGIFAVMQRILGEDSAYADFPVYVKQNFIQLRRGAEAYARQSFQSNGNEDITLEQIYEALGMTGQLSEEQLGKLSDLEIETEKRFLMPINENIEKVKKLVKCGKRVILISDMYLSSAVIRRFLSEMDLVFQEIPIYVSSECGKSKGTSNLYKYVQRIEKVSFGNWTHIGDNRLADVEMPQSLGIETEPYLKELLMPYEETLLEEQEDDFLFQVVSGITKKIRVNQKLSKEEEIGASFGGVLLYFYVQWLLNDAVRRGFEKLFFVARDGFVLKQIADVIIQNQNLDIETGYLYGSRQAWRLPSYSAGEDLSIFFCVARINRLRTIEEFSKIFAMDWRELLVYLPKEYQSPAYRLQVADYGKIRDYLEGDKDFKLLLERKAKEKRRLLQGYICQEVGGVYCAFVELSGSGITQDCFSKVAYDVLHKDVYTYFLNLADMKHSEHTCFLDYIPNRYTGIAVIENLCRALHGQTEGYREENGRYVPVLCHTENAALEKHGYREYVSGTMRFADEMSKNKVLSLEDKEAPFFTRRYISYVLNTPCEAVLDFIADMPFEETGYRDELFRFAPKPEKWQIRRRFLIADGEPLENYYEGTDFYYALKRCSPKEEEMISKYQKISPTNLGHMIRLIKRVKENGVRDAGHFLYRRIMRKILIRLGF